MAVSPARLESLVASELGCRITGIERLSGGRSADTYLLLLDDDPGEVVCKVGGPSVRTGDLVEPLVIDLVDRITDLPVPSQLGTGRLPGDPVANPRDAAVEWGPSVPDQSGPAADPSASKPNTPGPKTDGPGAGRAARPERPDLPDRPDMPNLLERPDLPDRPDHPDRSVRPSRPGQDVRTDGAGVAADDPNQQYALYEFREGQPPTPFRSLDPAVRRRVVADVGDYLGQLHGTAAFDRTGGLARDGDDLHVRSPVGRNFPGLAKHIARLHPRTRETDFEPVLTHGDLFPGNILVDDRGRISGLLDWGNAHVTTTGYALARAEMRFIDWFRLPAEERAMLRGALREQYQQHRDLPPDYPELTRWYKGLWLAQSADRVCRHVRSKRGRRQLKRHVHSILF